MKLDGIEHVTTWVGSGAERFVLVLDQIFPQSNVSQLVLMPKDKAARDRTLAALPELLATEFPEARARAKLLPNGPPVAYPVQFRVVGPDPAQVRKIADEVKALMRGNPNLRGINDNWNESVKVLRLEIDQDKARALGVSSQAIAQASRTLNSGSTIGQFRDGDNLVDIVLRQPLDERQVITDLGKGYVPTASGRSIPLGQVATLKVSWEPGVLWREGRDYAATVQGDIVDGLQGATVTAQLNPLFEPIRAQLPPGYRIEVAGAVEESSQGPGLDRRRRAADAVHHVHAADAAAAQRQPRAAGVPDRADGHRRRGRRAAAAGPALRLRRAARRDRADGHDHAQLGDPDRPDRAGPRARRAGLGCGRRSRGAPLAGRSS